MTTQPNMRQWIIYAGLALIVLASVAVSLKGRGGGEDTRFGEVISEFVNLSLAPDPRNMDFLSRARVQATNRAARLTHVQPAVISVFAKTWDISENILRLQIADPDQTNAFDHTGAVFDSPATLARGEAAPLSWALVTERAESRASQLAEQAACGLERRCGAWLLYWDDTTWYYAPVGTTLLNTAVVEAIPFAADLSLPLEE